VKRPSIILRGTARPVSFCPVSAFLKRSPDELKECALIDSARMAPTPCQTEPAPGGTMLHWVVESLAAGQERQYALVEAPQPAPAAEVDVRQEAESSIAVRVGKGLFTRYLYGSEASKPCLYPVIGPFGQGVTRAWPLEEVPGDSTDHPHHRSLFVAWGDVNGSDNWSEEKGHGRTVHRSFGGILSGCVLGRIVSLNDWLDSAGRRLMQDRREFTFYNVPSSFRLVDVSVTFHASEGDVRFGDTKEGGLISLRVATAMEVRNTGRIENAIGGINEAETWGKRASWCDYSGYVGGRRVGVAVFDHPSNPRYPTYWHVRDYGLMTANPFGLSHFEGKGHEGSFLLLGGGEACFRYRLFVHAGTAQEAGVRAKYLEWLFPPSAEVQD
jgi:hypothetical protein